MKITLADKSIAWFALLSGLTISAVAIWYSVAGLVSIFAAAVVPIIVMGVVLEISKLIATVWLKLNWHRAPVFIKGYLLAAIAILMLITSMGIFGFLSKAHSDAGLVSGDVQAKIAVYDEKIKTEKENIDANRKALKQMDEAVDQVMGRSSDEKGADKAVAIRRAQQKERGRLLADIATAQQKITILNEERAPIAAEVRKVEAEVGPIKYIANFIYGDNPDANVLEKAVTWVIIIIVVVFDPLAVILLLASQYSFQWFRQAREEDEFDYMETHLQKVADELNQAFADEKPKEETVSDDPHSPGWMFDKPAEDKSILEQHPYLTQPFSHFKNLQPIVHKPDSELVIEEKTDPLDQWNKMIEAAEEEVSKEKSAEEIVDEGIKAPFPYPENPMKGDRTTREIDGVMRNLIFNGSMWINADSSDQEAVNELDESKKKSSYMIRKEGELVVKTKE